MKKSARGKIGAWLLRIGATCAGAKRLMITKINTGRNWRKNGCIIPHFIQGAAMKKADVVRLFGGVSATARALGITRQAVSQWREPLSERVCARAMLALARQGRALDALMMAGRKEQK